MTTIQVDDLFVSYEDTLEMRDEVFNRVLNFYVEHQCFFGEVLMQADNPQIEAPNFLAEMLDEVFMFEVEYKDEE